MSVVVVAGIAGGGVFKDSGVVGGGFDEGIVEGNGGSVERGDMDTVDDVLVVLLVPDTGDPTVEYAGFIGN